MSGRNVEVVREVLERFRSGDGGEIREFVDRLWEPDADYYPVRKIPDARPRHGADEIAEFFTAWADSWEWIEFAPLEVKPIGDDRVFVQGRLNGRGRGMEVPLEGTVYYSVWLRHGRVLRWEDHLTEAGALHGLGLTSAESAQLQS